MSSLWPLELFPPPRILMLDNRDSFVFNLVDEFRRFGCDVLSVRNGISESELQLQLKRFGADLVVLSPGPGHPEERGVMVPWLRTLPTIPILGICLGHQAMGVAYGGRVGRAPRPVHGSAHMIELDADPLFEGLSSTFAAARYHSLVVTEVPENMKVIARFKDHEGELVMAMRHKQLPHVGLQFHPESILTPQGAHILRRFVHEAVTVNRKEPSSL